MGIPAHVQDSLQHRDKMVGAAKQFEVALPAVGQVGSIAHDSTAPEEAALRFAVVSIRPNKSGGQQIFGKVTPDGWETRNMFMGAVILTAYVPTGGGARFYSDEQLIGMPSWAESDEDRYDIDAKVDDADLQNWQNPARQEAILRAMLRNMLADRLKLKVHRSTKEEPVYTLVVAKGGPLFKESVPHESYPGRVFPMPGGGMISMENKDGWVVSHCYDISIAQLISLSLSSDNRPVQDKTGLAGKYDVTIMKPVPPAAGTPAVQPVETSGAEIANQLGLKLVPAQGQVETLVIDHVERPTAN